VQVSRVDLDARKIDFRLVREPNARTLAKTSGRAERGGAPVPAPAAGTPGLAGSASAGPTIRQLPKGGALLNGVQPAPTGKHPAKPKSAKVKAARAERGAAPAKRGGGSGGGGGGKAPAKRPGGPAKKPRR
jgi:ribonuclease R